MSETSGNDLVTEITYEVEPAEVITVPIDATLSIEGQAADAKAVGDAIAGILDDVHIQVNDEEADAQGKVIITGSGIPVSGTDTRTIDAAITAVDGKTGEDIAVSSTDATTLAAKVAGLDGRTGADIDVSATDTTSIADALLAADGKTGADIAVSATDSTMIASKLGTLDSRVTTLENEGIHAEGFVKSVNSNTPDTDGNVTLTQVPYAGNLVSDRSQTIAETFVQRTTGGSASIETGSAQLAVILGGRIWPDRVLEEITVTVDSDSITVTYDRATLIAAIPGGGTVTLNYTSEWSADPASYGLTVTGTPASGNSIGIVYVAEDRGTIIQATPTRFVSTGSNIYDYDAGYARVSKYADDALYGISGSQTGVKFAETMTGERETLTVNDGRFEVPGDGFVFVNGADAHTKIWPCWSDWLNGYGGDDGTYTESEIDLTGVMENFPYGLMQAGSVRDEINLQEMLAVSRVERLEYSAENLAEVIASGVQYEADTLYIYAEREVSVSYAVTGVHDSFDADDHGIEFIDGTDAPVMVVAQYGQDLKGKLQRDVLTVSQQALTEEQQAQARDNIGALNGADVTGMLQKLVLLKTYSKNVSTIAGGAVVSYTASQMGASTPSGYRCIGLVRQFCSSASVVIISYRLDNTGSNTYLTIQNNANAAVTNFSVNLTVAYMKSGYASY